ncbi:MAG TPA: hypothetical protein VD810_04660 [Methylophilaceae bacterium]|nr:hypothetical protein [Methylophilaceae bacterium]
MPYVLKNPDGTIKGVSAVPMEQEGWEFVEATSREYVGFLESALAMQDPFRESDIQLARVLEDLISLLIERDLLRFTDFPDAAQKRLIARQNLRKKNRMSGIIDEDENLI